MACDRSDDPCAFVDGVTAMSDKTIPPAFPLLPPVDDTGRSAVGYPFPDPGMTLRDYFAAEAMKEHMRALSNADLGSPREWNVSISEMAYLTADAMLKAREQ